METYRNNAKCASSDSEDEEIKAAMLSCKRKELSYAKCEALVDVDLDKMDEQVVIGKQQSPNKKRKINNVWSTVMNEMLLTDNLGQCQLLLPAENMSDRNCENYNFSRKALDTRPEVPEDTPEVKETVLDITYLEKTGFSVDVVKKSFSKKKKRLTAKGMETEKIARNIASKLKEPKIDLLVRTINELGKNKTLELVRNVEAIEKDGGLQIKSGCRRRTPGGVLFYLIRNDPMIEEETKDAIFFEDELRKTNSRKIKKNEKTKKKYQKKMHKRFNKNLSIAQQSEDSTSSNDLPPLPTRYELHQQMLAKQAALDGESRSPTEVNKSEDVELSVAVSDEELEDGEILE